MKKEEQDSERREEEECHWGKREIKEYKEYQNNTKEHK